MRSTEATRKAVIEDSYPLSTMQRNLISNGRAGRCSGANLEQVVGQILEALDLAAFEQAWQLIVQRHPILRSSVRITSSTVAENNSVGAPASRRQPPTRRRDGGAPRFGDVFPRIFNPSSLPKGRGKLICQRVLGSRIHPQQRRTNFHSGQQDAVCSRKFHQRLERGSVIFSLRQSFARR